MQQSAVWASLRPHVMHCVSMFGKITHVSALTPERLVALWQRELRASTQVQPSFFLACCKQGLCVCVRDQEDLSTHFGRRYSFNGSLIDHSHFYWEIITSTFIVTSYGWVHWLQPFVAKRLQSTKGENSNECMFPSLIDGGANSLVGAIKPLEKKRTRHQSINMNLINVPKGWWVHQKIP